MARTKTDDVIVYNGRFNPFHLGHAHVLQEALKRGKLVIVLLGSSGLSRSLKNPFTFLERKKMIMEWYEYNMPLDASWGTLMVKPSRDYPYNDMMWQRSVQSIVKTAIDDSRMWREQAAPSISLIGSDRDESTWYLHAFPQWKTILVEPYRQNGVMNVNATDVRAWLFSDGPSEGSYIPDVVPATTLENMEKFKFTPEYDSLVATYKHVVAYKERAKAYPYPPIYQTVDGVIVQSGHILTVVRGHEPGKGLWALPGGFVNANERLRSAAIREVIEETKIKLTEGKDPAKVKKITSDILRGSIRAEQVFDKPDRSDRGRTITHAYFFRLDDTKPLPLVKGMKQGNTDPECDVIECFWLPISEALERMDMWFEDHHAIVEWAMGHIDRETLS